MKSFLMATALGLGLLGAAVSTAGTARASGDDGRHAYGGYSLSKQFRPFIYGAPHHHYRQDDRHQRRHHSYWRGKHKRHKFVSRENAYRHGHRGYQVVRPCQRTSKIGFDGHGRRARIGGVMCYDTYGQPYIVQGSRFIIQYF